MIDLGPMTQKDAHGHVIERTDGTKARCGGPSLCTQCRMEGRLVKAARKLEKLEAANTKLMRAELDRLQEERAAQ